VTYRCDLGQPGRTAGDGRGAGRDRRRGGAPRSTITWRCSRASSPRTQRRVFDGETVPASDNPGSGPGLLEPHADIIVKGGRQVQYCHKLNLATGKSGLILNVVIEAGIPADAERFVPMLDRHIARASVPPRQTAADGGYASRAISLPPRPAASPMSPFTRSAASPSPKWSKALGCTAACATSAPA